MTTPSIDGDHPNCNITDRVGKRLIVRCVINPLSLLFSSQEALENKPNAAAASDTNPPPAKRQRTSAAATAVTTAASPPPPAASSPAPSKPPK